MSAITDVEFWTIDDVSQKAQVGRRTVYRAVRAGKLRGARINGRGELRFLPSWVAAWLELCASDDALKAA